MILDGFNAQDVESNDIANAIGFMTERLHSFSQNELASRLTLNCTPNHVRTQNLGDIPITILNLWDCYSHTESVKEDFRHCYPHAKLADLKSGGIFPFLSRSDEVNLHILVSLVVTNYSKKLKKKNWNTLLELLNIPSISDSFEKYWRYYCRDVREKMICQLIQKLICDAINKWLHFVKSNFFRIKIKIYLDSVMFLLFILT